MLLTVGDHTAFDSFHILGHLSPQSQEGKSHCAYGTIKDTGAQPPVYDREQSLPLGTGHLMSRVVGSTSPLGLYLLTSYHLDSVRSEMSLDIHTGNVCLCARAHENHSANHCFNQVRPLS